MVSCGQDHTLILDRKGMLLAGGSYSHGQLGAPESAIKGKPFIKHEIQCRAISAGQKISLIVTVKGEVLGAGFNNNGRLGMPNDVKTIDKFTKIELPDKKLKVSDVKVGRKFCYAVTQKEGLKSIYSWGVGV